MKVARDGQHSGNESTAFEKVVPCLARSFRTFGIFARSAAAWSSVITTRMFGRPSFAAVTGLAETAGVNARIASTAVAAVAHALMTVDRTLRVTRCQLSANVRSMTA